MLSIACEYSYQYGTSKNFTHVSIIVDILYPTPVHTPRMYPVVAHAPCMYCHCVPYCSCVTARTGPNGPSGPQHTRRSERSKWPATYSTVCGTMYHAIPLQIACISLCPLTRTSTPCIHTCMYRCMSVAFIQGTPPGYFTNISITTPP